MVQVTHLSSIQARLYEPRKDCMTCIRFLIGNQQDLGQLFSLSEWPVPILFPLSLESLIIENLNQI